jgi:hypothetical protein
MTPPRPGPRRIARAGFLLVASVALVVATPGTPVTLARLVDDAMSTATFTTDTLDPPTSLAATAVSGATLTWTPTVDTYASGYEVFRSATSGSGFASLKTVTPRSATTTTDSPGSGTWYYVLRSVFQQWRSVASNQASVTIGSPTTPFASCTGGSSAALTGGDNDGYETTPANACGSGGGVATDANTGTNLRSPSCTNTANDRHVWWGFATGLPTSVTSIDGITVRADATISNNGGTSNLCVDLSWDGGTSWTAIRSASMTSTGVVTYEFGGATDRWGHTPWTVAQLGTSTFRIRITDATDQNNKDFGLDWLRVSIAYTP